MGRAPQTELSLSNLRTGGSHFHMSVTQALVKASGDRESAEGEAAVSVPRMGMLATFVLRALWV